MRHTSIIMNTPCELISVTPLNPLISRCQIKVCYVGEEPNRNGSVITREVARQMANTLPGSPIVGFFNENTEDFEEHNRRIEIAGGKIQIEDMTRPYGFVDLNANVWFQDYLDDGVKHTYLVTEGYIWTGQYPETKRILDKGNNQSMELDEKSLDGSWTIDDKSGMEFFIINEAIISKLCILGEDFEPCFEGANITKFALEDEFNSKIYTLMKQVRELKGGKLSVEELNNEEITTLTEEEVQTEEEVVEENAAPAVENTDPVEENTDPVEDGVETEENVETQFSLEDYENLQANYNSLEERFNTLQERYNTMETNYQALVEFKNIKDREAKQAMIDSFYMLSEEDKKDVQDNIDTYSIEDIEAKLAIICVRNKLDLSGSNNETDDPVETTFSLNDDDDDNDNVPAWIACLRRAKKNEN